MHTLTFGEYKNSSLSYETMQNERLDNHDLLIKPR